MTENAEKQVAHGESARAPVVPEIRLKDKRIGLWAMRAGLKAKIGCHRRPQRRPLPAAVRPLEPP